MFRRITTLTSAAALAGAAFIGLAAGLAQAQPACPDIHWIGAAGSGERVDPTADGGMGRVVYQSYQELSERVQRDGRTLTAEAVEYPAVAVPDDEGGVGEWLGFMGSVDTGAAALGNQYASFVQRCPASKVVLAGYSQGAMVVHRNLHALAESPNLAAALLVADGDRLPEDPTLNLGTASGVPERGKGVAQDWPILAHAPAPLPPTVGARTISVCDLGDAVCDYDPDAEEVSSRAIAIHTSYARTPGVDWTEPLYFLLGPAPELPEAHEVTPLTASAPTQ
jgi:Cutinase